MNNGGKDTVTDLTVCVVTFNTRDLLRRCLKSVETARGDLALEIVVADNCSHDGTLEMLEQEFPSVQVIRNADNRGYAAAANQCLNAAKGRYISMLNPDAYVYPDTLLVMVQLMERMPAVGLASCLTLDGDGNTCATARHERRVVTALLHAFAIPEVVSSWPFVQRYLGRYLSRYYFQFKHQVENCEPSYLDGGFVLLRREVLKEVGGMDENLFLEGEDYDWCRRIKHAGWKIYFTTETKVVHEMHSITKSMRDEMFVQWFKSYVYIIRKHQGQPAYQLLRAGMVVGMLTRIAVATLRGIVGDRERAHRAIGRYRMTIKMCWEFHPERCLYGFQVEQQRARALGWPKHT